ncbi:MAG: hypothetical protein LBS56_06000 [Propionibacteriaceae bacterium]|jgi:secretion/DNA translocation related TadE-like protein|nr:hypothetical protein [Propionibacteriaceae bacterium]
MTPRTERERGAGTLMMAGLALFVAGLGVILVVFGAFTLAHQRAEDAADLAALSGAQAALDSGDPNQAAQVACAAARTTATAHKATVEACDVVAFAGFVGVEVEVSFPAPFAIPGAPSALKASARAGNTTR